MDPPSKQTHVSASLQGQLDQESPFRQISHEDLEKIDSVRVYPPIGIARVGSADIKYTWIGPEYPHLVTEQHFKVDGAHIRKQGCRFRVFGFHGSQPLGEISDQHAEISWSVNLVNSKSAFWKFQNYASIVDSDLIKAQKGSKGSALETVPAWKSQGFRNPSIQADKTLPSERKQLIIDTQNHVDKTRIEAPLDGRISFAEKAPQDKDWIPIHLGDLRYATGGSLVVIPPDGTAKQVGDAVLTDDFNTPGYYDTTGDGSIDVKVKVAGKLFNTGATEDNRSYGYGGWVLLAPPKFAPDLQEPSSIYDGIQDLWGGATFDDKNSHKDFSKWEPKFWKDVYSILRRPVYLAWTNPDAFGGHGPEGPGDFSTTSWQNRLQNPNDDAKAIRAEVFFRLRSPDPEIAKGQADRRWMPRLSGNGGRCTQGDPSTWSSLTTFQYKLLERWKDGKFRRDIRNPNAGLWYPPGIDPPPGSKTFQDLPIKQQLKENIRAHLYKGTGLPVYPGIEISWSYLLEETYSVPFRINRANIRPGDLNRFLSCPWQSDFYLCRNHWWPACRPDSVVPEEEYNRIMKLSGDKHKLKATELKRTTPWERGLRPQHSDTFGDLELVSNVDMIRHWEKLGFVLRTPVQEPTPQHPAHFVNSMDSKDVVFIEKERISFSPENYAIPNVEDQKLYDLIWDLMKFEFSTVPLYLYAAWSIKAGDGEYGPFDLASDNGLSAKQLKAGQALRLQILNVVSEEMLHLSLVGNLLTGIGQGQMIRLSDKDSLPSYPGQLPRHPPGFVAKLAPLTPEQLETFITIEKPAPRFAVATLNENASIAQSYAYIEASLEQRKDCFDNSKISFQFAPGEVYSPRVHDTGGSVVVTDLETAKKAIEIITTQGEGQVEDLSYSPYTSKLKQELSHYARFKAARRDIDKGKVQIWNMPTNPGQMPYPSGLAAVNDLFNGVYRYLLKTIDLLYRNGAPEIRKKLIWQAMFPAMTSVLPALADLMIHVKLPTGECGAPTFQYYDFPEKCCWSEHIQKILFNNAYQANITNGPLLERLVVIQVPIGNLTPLPDQLVPVEPKRHVAPKVVYNK